MVVLRVSKTVFSAAYVSISQHYKAIRVFELHYHLFWEFRGVLTVYFLAQIPGSLALKHR